MNHDLKEFWSDCELEKKLGSGTYGDVYLESCADPDEKRYNAAKIILLPGEKNPASRLMKGRPEDLTEESWLHRLAADAGHRLNLVKSMRGRDNVVFLEDYKVVKTKTGYTLYLRNELLTPLEDYLKEHAPTEETALRLCTQISEAIACYEKKGLFHRNIKPSNLFCDEEGNFKLGDPAFPKIQLPINDYLPPEASEKETGCVSDELYALCQVVRRLFSPTGRLAMLCEKACSPLPEKRFQTVEQFQRALYRIAPAQAVAEYTPPVAVQKAQEKKSRRALAGMFFLGVLLVTCLVLYGRLAMLFLTKTEPGQLQAPTTETLVLESVEGGGVLLPDLSSYSSEEVKTVLNRHGIQVRFAYQLDAEQTGKVLAQGIPANTVVFPSDPLWLLVACSEESSVTPRIQSIRLSEQSLSLSPGDSIRLTAEVLPAEQAHLPLYWISSDESILRVENGTVTALKEGTISLTVRDETGLARTVISVTVTPEKISVPNLIGKTEQEAESALTKLGFFAAVTYEYNTAEAGRVIRQDPEASQRLVPGSEVRLTVSLGEADPDHIPVTQLTLSHSVLQLNLGEEFLLEATLLPENASNTALSWLSSDRSVATVSSDGTVTAVSDGTAVIRAISADGSKSASCTVTVITASYTVIYDANGGTGTMEPSSHVYGKLKKLNDCLFSRTGYSFSGWALSPEATEPKFINTQTVGNLSSENGAVVRLYAVWSPLEYAITYDTNGGTLTGDDFFFVTFDGVFGPLATPQREGYEFAGWFSNRTNGIRITEDTPVTPDSPTTLYAHWRTVSEAVPEDKLPSGAEIVAGSEYWTYTLTTQKKSTVPVNDAAWKLLSSAEEWVEREDTLYYALFPEGFDTTHELYQRYHQELPREENGPRRKVEHLKTQSVGHLYWHWAQPQQGPTPENAAVSNKQSTVFPYFSAFESSVIFPMVDINGNRKDGLYYQNRQNATDGSWWWYHISIQSLTYRVEELTTVYVYEVTETFQSDSRPSVGKNHTRWVQYYVYE